MNKQADLFNVEFSTGDNGKGKWVRDVVSHTRDQIREAHKQRKIITLISKDGGESDVDLEAVFFIRFQDPKTFDGRRRELKRDGSR